jgi:DNA repair photolyase
LILRDIEMLKEARDFEVGFTVTTMDDDIRKLFESSAPPIKDRLNALDVLHRAGIRTYAMMPQCSPVRKALRRPLEERSIIS